MKKTTKKLSLSEVRVIRQLQKKGWKVARIAKKIKRNDCTVRNVFNHTSSQKIFPSLRTFSQITQPEYDQIVVMLENGTPYIKIAHLFKITRDTVLRVRKSMNNPSAYPLTLNVQQTVMFPQGLSSIKKEVNRKKRNDKRRLNGTNVPLPVEHAYERIYGSNDHQSDAMRYASQGIRITRQEHLKGVTKAVFVVWLKTIAFGILVYIIVHYSLLKLLGL